MSEQGLAVAIPRDLIKSPYVLEFLGLDEQTKYSESDLETAIIDKLEHFLLELGKGFLFEARQKRFTFDEDHYYVDLVFYNRLLRCYTLIDLKIGFGKNGEVLVDSELPANLIADWQEDEANQDKPFPSYARLLKQNGTPSAESRYSWTIDFTARRAKAREEMQPLLDEAARIKAGVVKQEGKV